jgi:response regulator RpfG family c-di-GMP phosphodiesterase
MSSLFRDVTDRSSWAPTSGTPARGQSAQDAAIIGLQSWPVSESETGVHLDRVREIIRILAEELSRQPHYHIDIDETYIDSIYKSSHYTRIGKWGSRIILLKPGKLTERNRIMRLTPSW